MCFTPVKAANHGTACRRSGDRHARRWV